MAFLQNSDVQSMFSQLWKFENNKYIPSDCCCEILKHILDKLDTEDPNSRHFRQNIGFSLHVKKNLIPLLIAVNDDHILEIVIKILANIITPIECLLPVTDLSGEDIGCLTILKLNWLLSSSKIAWANLDAIKRLTDIIKEKLVKLDSCNKETFNSYNEIICNVLRLIKHILHIPNDQYQNRILRMFFSEKLDDILIDLITNSNRKQWIILIVELIALIFKNQHTDQMARMLSNTVENMISDSSEDNESNTSLYPKNGASSSQENSSESSHSDDNNTEPNLKVVPFKEQLCNKNPVDKEGTSSLGVVEQSFKVKLVVNTQSEKSMFKKPESLCKTTRDTYLNQNKISKTRAVNKTKKVEQPNHTFKNRTNLLHSVCNGKAKSRLKKNTKKYLTSKSSILEMPNHFFILYFLQKFTMRFLQNCFNVLVNEVYILLTSNSSTQKIDSLLYFWIITYFCRFCKLIRLDLNSVRRIVSFKLISYILYEGLKISQKLKLAKRQKSLNIHLLVRHLHLVIMAIKEIVKLVEYFTFTFGPSPVYLALIQNQKDSSDNSEEFITWAKDLKSIFAILIRQYDNSIQGIEYLHDLITTNHLILSLFDNLKDCLNLRDGIAEHIKKFAAPDIMYHYGTVLQNYKTNTEFVNEVVLTMMHHINGEVENTTVLFQSIILKSFYQIVEEKDPLYNKWYDLIQYVINKH